MDWKWYNNIFDAVKEYGCKIIENMNLPTEDYISDAVNNYVFVSDYVKQEYSLPGNRNVVIYSGSDFTHFTRPDSIDLPDNCIGRVYRLERDKMNESSIDVFIEVLKRRKGTKALISRWRKLNGPFPKCCLLCRNY
jgi:hypothetical protein